MDGTAAASEVAACEAWIKTRHSGDTPMVHAIGSATVCVDTNSVGLTAELATSFAALLAKAPQGGRLQVVIRSLGGDVRHGIAMGEALQGRPVAVFVSTFCGSSCANYIFLPARERNILTDGVVFFHGGINKAIIGAWTAAQSGENAGEQRKADVRRRIEGDLERQHALLARSGVDPRFFEWMEGVNADAGLVGGKCPSRTKVKLLVFSDAFLKGRGAPIATNRGPRSQARLDQVLERYGLSDGTCFWT